MGAMENKSLNIFNSRLVIASPATSTDLDFARVEGVVAHEYFHKRAPAATLQGFLGLEHSCYYAATCYLSH